MNYGSAETIGTTNYTNILNMLVDGLPGSGNYTILLDLGAYILWKTKKVHCDLVINNYVEIQNGVLCMQDKKIRSKNVRDL